YGNTAAYDFFPEQSAIPLKLTVELWIAAGVRASADSRKNRDTAGTTLDHKIDGNEALEQWDRQLDAGEWAAVVAADRELAAPYSGRQSARHAEATRRDRALNRR